LIPKATRLIMLAVAVMLTFTGCAQKQSEASRLSPSHSVTLPKALKEISALQWMSNDVLACLEDENGIIYHINPSSGAILDQFPFDDPGDYEGITFHQGSYYVLKSNGNILKVKGKNTSLFKFKKNKDFDFEGLCFDPVTNNLLVACKTHGDKDKDDNLFIYSFSLADNEYSEEPFLKLKKKKVHPDFKASAIARHPLGDLYVLSGPARLLLILSPANEVKQLLKLDKETYPQAEGLTFSPTGEMYIANEKNKTGPSLLTFPAR